MRPVYAGSEKEGLPRWILQDPGGPFDHLAIPHFLIRFVESPPIKFPRIDGRSGKRLYLGNSVEGKSLRPGKIANLAIPGKLGLVMAVEHLVEVFMPVTVAVIARRVVMDLSSTEDMVAVGFEMLGEWKPIPARLRAIERYCYRYPWWMEVARSKRKSAMGYIPVPRHEHS